MSEIPSLVRPYGCHSSEHCGYCKGDADGLHTTWGMGTEQLTVSDYQYLIDRGWRRSGTYCYKPMNEETCCPCYTIRCDASRFRPSRSHKRLLKAVFGYLKTGTSPRLPKQDIAQRSHSSKFSIRSCNVSVNLSAHGDVPTNKNSGLTGDNLYDPVTVPPSSANGAINCFADTSRLLTNANNSVVPSGDSKRESKASPSRAKRNKARALRWETKLTKMKARAIKEKRTFDELLQEYQERRARRLAENTPKTLEELLSFEPVKGQVKHYIELRLVRSSPPCREFQRTLKTSYQVYQKYQMKIHGDQPDECTMEGFKRFLVTSPLVSDTDAKTDEDNAAAPPFGSYHQQYWLDGNKLIAVGVIDLLPSCLSSVYLFYDPDYSFLHLGTYSALREIGFVRHLMRAFGPLAPSPHSLYARFDSYYMGYFIQSCSKMAYKAQFRPSFLCCPESYNWVPIETCLQRLRSSSSGKYARFSDEHAEDQNQIPGDLTDQQLDSLILCRLPPKYHALSKDKENRPLTLSSLSHCIKPEGLQRFREWAKLVGKRVIDGHFQIIFS